MTDIATYDRVAKFYDFLKSGDTRRWGEAQRVFFKQMHGRVLYVGMGTGQEIVNFPPGLEITAIDISRNMLEQAHRRASLYPGNIRPVIMNTENLGFPDDSFDIIITVCVFCTVQLPVQGLKELKRVLKPDGKILMFEHVLSKIPIFGLILKANSQITTRISGTHLDRDTVGNLKKAGFFVESEHNIYLDIVKAIVGHK